MSLTHDIVKTARSGSYQYAVVEAVTGNLVSVRLGINGTGSRLTNLNHVGNPVAGELVVIDYSTSVPYVRTLANIPGVSADLTQAAIPLDIDVGEVSGGGSCNPYSLTSGEYCGSIAYISGTDTFGVPLRATAGGMTAANANSIATAIVLGMGVGSGVMLVDGWINNSAWSGLTVNNYVFLGTGGGITQTKPTGTDQCVVILGVAIATSLIRFKPELVIVELL